AQQRSWMVGIEREHTLEIGPRAVRLTGRYVEIGRQEMSDAAIRIPGEPLGDEPGGLLVSSLVAIPVRLTEQGGRGRPMQGAPDGSLQKRSQSHPAHTPFPCDCQQTS